MTNTEVAGRATQQPSMQTFGATTQEGLVLFLAITSPNCSESATQNHTGLHQLVQNVVMNLVDI